MPYMMTRRIPIDGALLVQKSHWDVSFTIGARLPANTSEPVMFDVDATIEGRKMPTLFTVPALVATKPFYELLLDAGVDNVDVYSSIIHNPESGEKVKDYVVLNVVGVFSCADMDASDHAELGPGIAVVDRIVIDQARLPSAQIFRLAEDPLQLIISDHLHDRIIAAEYEDVYLEELVVRP